MVRLPFYPSIALMYSIGVMRWIGSTEWDASTDQPERMMFWPSVSRDGDYYFYETGDEWIDPDKLLAGLDLDDDDYTPAPTHTRERITVDEDELIPEGGRNKAMFIFASRLRGMGLSRDEIRDMLGMYNDNRCSPPLPDEELNTICRSVCSKFAPGVMVLPDLRDAWDDFHDLGEWVETARTNTVAKTSTINLIRGRELSLKDIPPLEYVVENLIAQGLTVLVAPPKYGKSWMCLDLAVSVVTGTPFMGRKTEKGKVLYLALEDGERRIQEREEKVRGDRGADDAMMYAIDVPTLDNGLIKELDRIMAEEPGIKLVIVDTFQKVRGVAGRTEGAYAYDYRETGVFKKFADAHGISVILVHHTNKKKDDTDVFSAVSGTQGIMGAADATIMLMKAKRMDNEATLTVTGRDVEAQEIAVAMDGGTYRWMALEGGVCTSESHAMLEASRDPITLIVESRLEEAEDLLGDAAGPVEYQFTAQDVLDSWTQITGKKPNMSIVNVGRRITELAPYWEKVRGWAYEQIRKTNYRGHSVKLRF